MTGKAFLKRLLFQLDFMMPEDRKTVLSYYERKLAETGSPEEEEAMVKTFGSPEHIAGKLKEAFQKQKNTGSEDITLETVELSVAEVPEDNCQETADPEEPAETLPLTENDLPAPSNACSDDSEEQELIFSKPAVSDQTPEIVHSLENKEIPSLFGEKVIIEERKEPIEEIALEPLDEANGLTLEEIETAKAKTLEKAEQFDTAPEQNEATSENDTDSSSTSPEASSSISENTDAVPNGIAIELDEDVESDSRFFPGIFKKLLNAAGISGGAATGLIIILSIIASPLILFAFGICALLYAFLMVISACLAVLSFALIAGLLVGGVIELVYGFAMLFDTVSVALIELGLGTVLFSLVIAVSAMIYEFLFGVLPKAVKWLTRKFTKCIKVLFCYLYGGNA